MITATLITRDGGFVFGFEQATTELPTTDLEMREVTGRVEPLPKWSFAIKSDGTVYRFDGADWVALGGE
jgi:hypothetical protein